MALKYVLYTHFDHCMTVVYEVGIFLSLYKLRYIGMYLDKCVAWHVLESRESAYNTANSRALR